MHLSLAAARKYALIICMCFSVSCLFFTVKPRPTDHIPKQSYCPSWKWYGGICIAVGVAAVLINPDVVNILTSTGKKLLCTSA